MDKCLQEGSVNIRYEPMTREYSITMRGVKSLQGIEFCPWCGLKLPPSLRDEYFDFLEKLLNIDSLYKLDLAIKNNVLPEEFKTDEWWKKRGL